MVLSINRNLDNVVLPAPFVPLANEEANIGLLIVNLQQAVEKNNDAEILKCVAQINEYKASCEVLTGFLDRLEADLKNPEMKKISLLGEGYLLDEIKSVHKHPYYDKTELSREEAQTLVDAVHRKLEQEAREIQQRSQDANRFMENRQQFVDIFKTVIQLLGQLHQTLTRNQRV
jgi:hypothetical protein